MAGGGNDAFVLLRKSGGSCLLAAIMSTHLWYLTMWLLLVVGKQCYTCSRL